MTNRYRFIDYQRATGAVQREISLHQLYPEPEKDEAGRIVGIRPAVKPVSSHEVLKLFQPYISTRFLEQFTAVVPLAAALVLFQLIILRHVVEDSWIITAGMLAVILGLMCFMEGLKLGLMPFGTVIGATLPRKSSLPVVLIITLLLGVGVTFAEPAIGALKTAGQNVVVERAPYLYALLNHWSEALVLVVGASVGCAAVIGTLRFLYGWSLKPLIYASLVPVLGLSVYAANHPEFSKALGLAWDTGAVTTGPVTVPLVLSLGIGIAAAAGKGDSGLSGFGIVTLASLFPIGGVLILLLYVASTVTPAEIITAAASHAAAQAAELAWYQQSPGQELVLGIRAILPLVLFLFLVLKVMLKEQLQHRSEIFLGIGLTMIGMCIFNLGLTYGLANWWECGRTRADGVHGGRRGHGLADLPVCSGALACPGVRLGARFRGHHRRTGAERLGHHGRAVDQWGVQKTHAHHGGVRRGRLRYCHRTGEDHLRLAADLVDPARLSGGRGAHVLYHRRVCERGLGQRRCHHGPDHGTAGAGYGDRFRQRDESRGGFWHSHYGISRTGYYSDDIGAVVALPGQRRDSRGNARYACPNAEIAEVIV